MNEYSFLHWLHGSDLAGEEVYLAPADQPALAYATSSIEEAEQYIEEQKGRGAFVSTGTFQPGTARQQEHLLSVPVVVLDADLTACLAHEGVADAETRMRTCTAKALTRLRETHLRLIRGTLARVGVGNVSSIVFSGGGHHAYFLIDFLDRREVGRIRSVHKALVATLNDVAGFPLFDVQVVDSGTRYIRVPGTANAKCTPIRFAEVVQNSGPTFTLEQLEHAAGLQLEQPQVEPERAHEEGEQPPNEHDDIVTLLLPYWTVGQRHNLALSLCGYLGKGAWPWRGVKALLIAIATKADDEELRGRFSDLRSTYTRLAKGEQVKGYTSLATLLSAEDLRKLEVLVGVKEIPIDETPPKLTLITRPYSEIQERETSWLWYPYLPARNVVSVEGNPGEGKSWITTALCAAVSIGKLPFMFSDGRSMAEQEGRDLCAPAHVLHLNIEDDPEETIKKRLRLLGADCSLVHCIEGVRKTLENGDKVLHFTVDQIPPLEESILHHKARLIVLDPVQAYLPKGADMNKMESVRPLMSGLMQMARRTNCTVVLVRHFGKRMTDTAIHKAIGSIDFAACVRSALIVGLYPKEKDSLTLFERGAVTHAKSNLAPRGLSLDFELRQDSFLWVGTSDANASDFTAPRDSKADEERGKIVEAMEFLKEILARGVADRSFLLAQGKVIGLSESTIDRAATKLHVKKQRVYQDSKVIGATWELPI